MAPSSLGYSHERILSPPATLVIPPNYLVERAAGLPDGSQDPAPPVGQSTGLMQPAASPHPTTAVELQVPAALLAW
ncbi:hypothetical protein CC1G_14721 [Coprinopsis cinerea okayama7|uniref:Uncharacterized protein n=1 Tax=Coprinopsis cinerea (strain Okayama-7 / 130 / ATCC MYA-4618 / FGSC 9003) TaxID=240176 RepID=D6RN10_COPC7|nr:hypothetical protein CC1G_14721 [Coprinopsis cinerea okayama7\|eukprot:XP_002911292.1 hypothetical protein CC1G_14721 [Coprinopsis cinerea okayama7\